MGRLQGKIAIVSGAGSTAEGWSNGKATAVLFARAKVFAVDRVLKAAEETRTIILGMLPMQYSFRKRRIFICECD